MLEIKRRLHVDRDYILEKTCRHGEYKYTADDYSTARIDNHKIMFLRSTTNTGMIRETLLLTAKLLGNFILRKNKNSLAPRWHDKFLPEPYAC